MAEPIESWQLAILQRNGGAVKRYHTVRTLRGQTNAEHSWGVAALVLCVQPQPSAALLIAALMHDMAEVRTGDWPATIKWMYPDLNERLASIEREFHKEFNIPDDSNLTTAEVQVLKWCDYAELTFWCLEESAMGNSFIDPLIERGLEAMERVGHPTDQARIIFDYLTHASAGDFDDMVSNDGK